MTIDEAFQRGNNLVATGILALSGFAFLPEFFLEDEPLHRLDEALLFIIGIAALAWYLRGRNKVSRSLVPVLLVVAASIGVAAFPRDARSAQELIAAADAALYQVKDAGGHGAALPSGPIHEHDGRRRLGSAAGHEGRSLELVSPTGSEPGERAR